MLDKRFTNWATPPALLLLETGTQYIAQAHQELSVKPRLALNRNPPALGMKVGITGVCHHAWLAFSFFIPDDRFVRLTDTP